jgi:hypothetical protein
LNGEKHWNFCWRIMWSEEDNESDAKVNFLWLASMEFTSRVDLCRWLYHRVYVCLFIRGCLFMSWAFSNAQLAGTEWTLT